jgi:multiple sugar transport system substrate-binding protein
MTLRVALVGGPMYDGLYALLPRDVEVVVHADHPTLNRRVAELLGAGERIDLLATHSKYAPSQARWLRDLSGLVDVTGLVPRAVDLCRTGGRQLCVPRNVDVRTLWWRTDRLDTPPATWVNLIAGDAVFGFTGRESGLFGLFFELVTGAGGTLFDAEVRPTLATDEAHWAVEAIARLGRRAPADLPGWHYDDVDRALGEGEVDLAAAWPGGTAGLLASPSGPHLAPARYPAGSHRWVSYSGCHAWAVPTTAVAVDEALATIATLTGDAGARLDAAAGTVPARADVLPAVPNATVLRDTAAQAMITFPPLAAFPAVEDAGWQAIHDVLRGDATPREALVTMQRRAEEVLRDEM